MSVLLLFVGFWSAAWGTELEQVRVFLGQDHAQVLLVADAPLAPARSKTTPAMGEQPAIAQVTLPGLDLDDRLVQAYGQDAGRTVIQLDDQGLSRVLLWEQDGATQVRVELDGPRELHLRPVGTSALLVDLQKGGAPPDSSLPSPTALASWLSGVSLTRQAKAISRPRKLVVIDAGHGGHDPGAIGVSGTKEADLALAISRKVTRELERHGGIEVVMTRRDDTFIPLKERAAMANNLDADLFVSIHANAAPWRAWGVETFYLDSASDEGAARVASRENALLEKDADSADHLMARLAVAGTNRLSRDLAVSMQTNVMNQLQAVFGEDQVRDLGVKTALFYVLVSTRMPAVLFESGFVTDADDEMRLRHPAYQQTLAVAISQTVVEFLDAQDAGRK